MAMLDCSACCGWSPDLAGTAGFTWLPASNSRRAEEAGA